MELIGKIIFHLMEQLRVWLQEELQRVGYMAHLVRMPKSIVSTSSSSHSYSVESSYPNSSYRALQKEIKNKEEEIKKKDDFILEMKRQMDSMKEYLMNNLGYHGGTSNIGQGMPPPLTPSMPPPMAP
jgi:hypothetical protein